MLILTPFDSLAITYPIYIISSFQEFHFPIKLVLDSSKSRKALRISFQALFFEEFFDKNFCFLILHKLSKFHYQTLLTSKENVSKKHFS